MKPDWKDAPEWANYLAMDGSGEWFWFEKEPMLVDEPEEIWRALHGEFSFAGYSGFEESLEKISNKDILSEIHKIDKEMGRLKQLKIKLQNECKHENARFTYSSDTGNWCPDDDTYWKDWYCPDCTKNWTETA